MKKSIKFMLLLLIMSVFGTQAFAAEALPNFFNAKDIYEKCSSAVFFIETYDMYGDPYARGSGFLIDKSGIAVTNLHMLESAFSAKATLTNAKELAVEKIIGISEGSDLAVIKLKGDNLPYLNMGDSEKALGGEKIYTIGSPMGLSNTISEGIISNPKRMVNNKHYMQISAPISYGSSGGALINDEGQVIGVTTAGYDVGQNLNFAVPINVIKSVLNEKKAALSFAELAKVIAFSQYKELPKPFEYIEEEIEPNNTSEQAQYIENGRSILGSIDSQTADYFWTICNTTGILYISCFGDGDALKNVTLQISASYDDELFFASEYVFDDGEVALESALELFDPNIIEIAIKRKDGKPLPLKGIDYTFYYEFVPEGADALK